MANFEIIEKIKECLNPCCALVEKAQYFSDVNWTEIIKRLLGDLGHDNGCELILWPVPFIGVHDVFCCRMAQ